MRKFFVNVIAAVAMLVAASSVKADDVQVFQQEAIAPVVQLARNCSGVVVDTTDVQKTFIVTANHCVDGKTSGRVTIDTKEKQKIISTEEYVYDVVVRDVTEDVAFLQLRKEGLFLEGAVIAQEDPQEGETVWAVGYPLGLSRLITQGIYAGYDSLDLNKGGFSENGDYRGVYRASPPIFGGNSGGGLFIKRDGHYQLVGISDIGVPMFFVESFFNPQTAINDIVNRGLKIASEKLSVPVIEQKKTRD